MSALFSHFHIKVNLPCCCGALQAKNIQTKEIQLIQYSESDNIPGAKSELSQDISCSGNKACSVLVMCGQTGQVKGTCAHENTEESFWVITTCTFADAIISVSLNNIVLTKPQLKIPTVIISL